MPPAQENQARPRKKNLLTILLDRVIGASFLGSGLALGLIAFCYCYEVVLRYFFNAPTEWAHDTATYLMCVMIFLALPEVTRTGGHIAITFVLEYLGERWRSLVNRISFFLSGLVCGLASLLSLTQNLKQFENGIQTLGTIPIPKWWVSSFITFGLFFSALLFLGQSFKHHRPEEETDS